MYINSDWIDRSAMLPGDIADVSEEIKAVTLKNAQFRGIQIPIPRDCRAICRNGWVGSDPIEEATAEWGEMMLRPIFDLYRGDAESEYIMRHADLEEIKRRRRENYQTLLDALPEKLNGLRPVFPALTENAVPSHFSLYADDRQHLLDYLAEKGISYKVFWPVVPWWIWRATIPCAMSTSISCHSSATSTMTVNIC